jgi:hypothetical protein
VCVCVHMCVFVSVFVICVCAYAFMFVCLCVCVCVSDFLGGISNLSMLRGMITKKYTHTYKQRDTHTYFHKNTHTHTHIGVKCAGRSPGHHSQLQAVLPGPLAPHQ